MSFTPIPGQRVEGYDLSERRDTDFYTVFRDIPDVDREAWDRARTFADEVIPVIDDYWDRGEYNLDFARRMGELDLFADGIEHEGLTHLSPLAAGLVNMEISRGDGSMGTILAVQGGLALRTLALFGSEEQKARYLLPVSRGEVLAAFALTEPDHGSDSVSLETEARLDAGDMAEGAVDRQHRSRGVRSGDLEDRISQSVVQPDGCGRRLLGGEHCLALQQ